MPREIRAIDHTNRTESYRVLATAFAEDPVVRWVNPDPSRDEAVFRGIDLALHGSGQGESLLYDDGVAVGAALWDPPGHKTPERRQVRALPVLAGAIRLGLYRGYQLARATAAVHPKEPHWYLATIGATVTGKGIGSALLEHQLDQIDGPAYLESSNIRNNPLYERFGFTVVSEIRPAKNGPTMWAMYRK